MKSPFPGMDPYLEEFWGDVHTSLTTYARNALQPQMPPDLRVRAEEYVAVETALGEQIKRYKPDVRVIERPKKRPRTSAPRRNVAVAEPTRVEIPSESETLRYVKILDASSRHRVVTVIEFLSDANKCPPGTEQFRIKQRRMLTGGTSVVEIDLLRSGAHVLSVPSRSFPMDFRRPYRICVIEAWDREHADVYRAGYRERLPVINIPLRKSDPPAILDLQELVDRSYADGEYGLDIDYSEAAQPPLEGDDARWADKLLRTAGRR